jgi:hypothetical protein
VSFQGVVMFLGEKSRILPLKSKLYRWLALNFWRILEIFTKKNTGA